MLASSGLASALVVPQLLFGLMIELCVPAFGLAGLFPRVRKPGGQCQFVWGFAAVIVDIGLPDRSGDDLVREIRSMHAALPILVATGKGAQDVRKRG
jgi:CheY-like chemotaxis protein